MKTFIINLERDKIRREHVEDQLKRENIENFEFF